MHIFKFNGETSRSYKTYENAVAAMEKLSRENISELNCIISKCPKTDRFVPIILNPYNPAQIAGTGFKVIMI